MKKLSFLLVMMICLLMSIPAEATEVIDDCAHEEYYLSHFTGQVRRVCSACQEWLEMVGYCKDYDDDNDGICDVCGNKVNFEHENLYASMEEAAAAMRVILQNRDLESEIYFEITKEQFDDENTSFVFQDVVFRHTGVFNEGDYLSSSFIAVGLGGGQSSYGDKYYMRVEIAQIPCATTAEQEDALYAKIEEIISENGWADLGGFDQIKAVYDWVCENVTYDHEHFAECDPFSHYQDMGTLIHASFLPHSAYNAIFEGQSVCQGYAQLMYLFYNKLGVDCRYVSGSAGGPHAWNIVELDGLYYFIDATWDSQLHQAGQEYEYFLRSEANMKNHSTDDKVLDGYDVAKHDYGYVPGPVDEIIESGTMGTVEWRITGDGTLTFSGEGNILENPVSDKSLIEKIVIGDGISEIGTIDYDRWVSGDSYAVFGNCTNLKSVEFGTGLTIIGDIAFGSCESLTEIAIPDNVIDIGYQAFNNCKTLQSVSLPENIRILRNGLFGACYELVNINIPDSVTEIQGYAFDYCQSLVTVELPEGLQRLGHRAFYECISLEEISIPGSVKTLELQMFFNCTSLNSVTLNEGLETLEEGVFYNCSSLEEIILPSTVTAVGRACFSSTPISEINLPDSMTEIPGSLFSCCEYLESIVIPEGVTKIGSDAFYGCKSLTEIDLPAGVTEIEDGAFNQCTALKEIDFPAGITAIGGRAFEFCESLQEIDIPPLVTDIPYNCFYWCTGLKTLVIPDNIVSIGEGAFRHCENLTSVTFSENLSSIGGYAFYDCEGLTSVALPDSLTSMGERAFESCFNLQSVTLPENMTFIGERPFTHNFFRDYSAILFCKAGSSTAAQIGKLSYYAFVDPDYPDFRITQNLDDQGNWRITLLQYIGSGVSAVIPEELNSVPITEISQEAFYNSGVSSICCNAGSAAAAALSSINRAFIDPSEAQYQIRQTTDANGNFTITIDKYIGSEAELSVPSAIRSVPVTALGDNSFYANRQIRSISLPDTVTEIASMAFYCCYDLQEIVLPEGITAISKQTFQSCSSLTSIVIPEQVTRIGSHAFYDCENLAHIVIKGTNVTLDASAFSGSSRQKYIFFMGEAASIGEAAFGLVSEVHMIFMGNNAPVLSGNGVFADNSSVTVYCYTASDIAPWAADNGFEVVYLDGEEACPIQQIILPADCRAEVGTGFTVEYDIFPPVSDSQLKWSSSDEAVVSVSDTGAVNVLSAGEATVTCSDPNGTAMDSMVITAYIGTEFFDLSQNEAWLIVGNALQLSVENLSPENSSAMLTWHSSDNAAAAVDENGLVMVRAAGDVTVTARYENGVSRDCLIHVYSSVTDVSFQAKEAEVPVNTAAALTVNVTADAQNLVNMLVRFESSDPSVASVDQNGLVTGHMWGTAIITAASENGVSDSCTVTVTHEEHEWVNDEPVDPTCTQSGWVDGTHCAVCMCVGTAPTEVPASGHSYESAVTEPTCTEGGWTTYTCIVCGDSYTADETVALGHAEVIDPEVPATHITTGLTAGTHCFVCGEIMTARKATPVVEVPQIKLPAMLKAVEAQAFQSSMFRCVIIPDGCERLEAECFADNLYLDFVEIPPSVVFIDETAFEGTGVIIVTTDGSHAQDFAQRFGYPCVIVEPEKLTGSLTKTAE